MLIPPRHTLSSTIRIAMIIAMTALSCLLVGCNSEPERMQGMVLSLQLPGNDIGLNEMMLGRGDEGYVRRCVIEVLKSGSNERIDKRIFVPDIDFGGRFDVGFDLPEGEYDFKIWSDYVRAEAPEVDLCYSTADLDEVKLCLPRPDVDVPFRDAAYGFLENVRCTSSPDRIGFNLRRAVGRYTVLGEKVSEYLLLWLDSPDRFPAVEMLRLEVTHNYFMPSSFCISDGKLKSSIVDDTYLYDPSRLPGGGITADDELPMADDIILVGDKSVMLMLTINVWGTNGRYVGYIRGLPVEVRRDRLTVIRGDFLALGAPTGTIILDHTWTDDFIIRF